MRPSRDCAALPPCAAAVRRPPTNGFFTPWTPHAAAAHPVCTGSHPPHPRPRAHSQHPHSHIQPCRAGLLPNNARLAGPTRAGSGRRRCRAPPVCWRCCRRRRTLVRRRPAAAARRRRGAAPWPSPPACTAALRQAAAAAGERQRRPAAPPPPPDWQASQLPHRLELLHSLDQILLSLLCRLSPRHSTCKLKCTDFAQLILQKTSEFITFG
jgi:hypothetical protein